jgi:recombination protein U
VQGIPVCFDAKECASTTFTLENIHPHQVSFMDNFEKQDGVAFFLIYYSSRGMYYYLPFRQLKLFWDRAKAGGRKSFRLDELDMDYMISDDQAAFIPYLELLQKDLEDRD